MLMSPTTSRDQPDRVRQGSAGMTLVEILVVLSIVAIASGVVMIRSGIGQSTSVLDADADRLSGALTETADLALFSGRDAIATWSGSSLSLQQEGDAPRIETLSSSVSFGTYAGTARLSADGNGLPFKVVLRQGTQSRALQFDGVTASVLSGDKG